jgi:uncharacterized protein (DUF2141 family)
MKKWIMAFIVFTLFVNFIHADVTIKIEIHNVIENGGKIYVGVYFNENAYKNKRQNIILQFDPTSTIVTGKITLPEGEYVLDAYQDTNNNSRCDFGLLNIPKEPIGITNYNGGIPGNFNKLKVIINNETEKIQINMYKF